MKSRPRIAINTRFLINGKMEGFGWYTYEVTKRIVESHPEIDFYFFFDRKFDNRFIFSDNVTPIIINPPARHPVLFYLWFEIGVKRALKKHNIDLFFSPDGYLSLSSKVKQICTIHDINFEHYPKDIPFAARKYLRHFFPRFARKADHILTVSNYSKTDISTKYRIDEKKISVVWNGASEIFRPLSDVLIAETRGTYSEGSPYFIYVGSIHPRKNVRRLVDAFIRFKTETNSTWKLLIVGEAMWNEHELGTIKENHDIVFTGRMELSELAKLVAAAGALSFVPYFEGFGIPLVEAMKCGVPILSGDKTSLPEIVGDAAIFCDPFDIQSIAIGMKQLSSDDSLREQLSKLGLERSKIFSWDISANKTWGIISDHISN